MNAIEEPDPVQRDWAVFAYICGDNAALAAHARRQVEGLFRFTDSANLHVAAQWDVQDDQGPGRGFLSPAGWKSEPLERVNTGDPNELVAFLRWAFDRCPCEHVIIAVSGTGLLDNRASMGGPENDRSHLFTICDDAGAGDALSLQELRTMLQKAIDATSRQRIDILALDMRELQCLEVAYEIEELVDVLIAPQTRVPDAGFDFEAILRASTTAIAKADPLKPVSVLEMGRTLVRSIGATYRARQDGELSLSALNLRMLKPVTSAFDTLSLAMVHSVGEEMVWQSRKAVAERLKTRSPSPQVSEASKRDVAVEIEYLYDLVEMLQELHNEFKGTALAGVTPPVLDYLCRLDQPALARALQSVDDACFTVGSNLHSAELQRAISNPRAVRRRLQRVRERIGAQIPNWRDTATDKRRMLKEMFSDPAGDRRSWLDDWPEQTLQLLEPALANTYRVTRKQLQRLAHLAALTDRVLYLLTGKGEQKPGSTPQPPLVLEHFTSEGPTAVSRFGVSLFRPRDLDQLIASDYLGLRFNRTIHWTVLLAVINLIENHPRALWRILSAVLATADNSTRTQLFDRITGPGSVIAPFRDQFVVLAPPVAFALSLQPEPMSSMPDDSPQGIEPGLEAQAYRVTLELAERDAFISETTSLVNPKRLNDVIGELTALMNSTEAVTADDLRRIESLGATMGEDILRHLGRELASAAKRSSEHIHLQLQIPRALMPFPWELMQHPEGWLTEDFALGRQVFARSGAVNAAGRVPGPLRALIIGNPKTGGAGLPYASQEANTIASLFEALGSETDGLIDFTRARDARIGERVTQNEVREMLRGGGYDIIHFAGHATYDRKRPERSGWQLSDGLLTAQEIMNTLAWRDTQPWLVFANACEAAMDGRVPSMYQNDVFGLASAFLEHGVSGFVGPLWRIDDAIASEIARTFYMQLLKERQTVGESLRQAKAQAKRTHFDAGKVANPSVMRSPLAMLSWAGLVLYGNSTATVGQRMGAPSPQRAPEGRRA